MELVIKSDNFEEKVIKSSKPVLVDFWATWCGPCQMQGPVIEQLADEAKDFYVGKVNVDEEPDLQMRYGISSIPSLLIFNNGECVKTLVGFHTKEQILNEMSGIIK
ncbi:MAG TPA: thioredoxin [Lachnospiraceae bacterium]|nr:thioredoxin [Lachnospiraceae bacterium]